MTFGRPQTLMMSGAWPPPAPSVWKAWMVRPLMARDGVLDEAALVQRVGVDHHLHVVLRRRRRGSSRSRPASCPSPRAASARRRRPSTISSSAAGQRGVALAGKADVHREGVDSLDHPRDVPGAGRAGGGERAVRRAGAAAEHGGDAATSAPPRSAAGR